MVAADARASETHRILTQIGDAITRRLIDLAWAEFARDGVEAPPGGYCWVAFGSQAREEHALGSDQDNALVLGDSLSSSDPALRRLSLSVCEGLEACGYPRCEGDIMAAVDRWRQPVSAWRRQFSKWIREPTKDAVMHGSIFFDMRAIHGDASLVNELEDHVAREIAARPLFLAHLAREAMVRRPPLGFFGQLVVEHGGEHGSTLDLKHRGLIPIVDMARVHGLEAGCRSANTPVRLTYASERGGLSESGRSELLDAFECIGGVRLRLHARSITQGKSVSNYLDPTELSPAERGPLKDAFSVVSTLQRAMENSRQLSLVSE
jgi:CBS domain-containing protein